MATRMQQKRGTAAQWASANPILAAGEIGFAFDTFTFKIGDGVKTWTQLENAYVTSLGGDTIKPSAVGVVGLAIQALTGQTANLFEFRDAAGTTVTLRVAANGDLYQGASKVATAADITAANAAAIAKTIVDAKGDLIVGTAADTVARMAKGADGTALVSDSSTSTGLVWGAMAKAPQIDTFTTSGTWTKPAGARLIEFLLIGGGDGGDGGAYATSNGSPGRGGEGGSAILGTVPAGELAATEAVTVGAGGAGGAAAATVTIGTSGGSGGSGGNTTFDRFKAAGGTSNPSGSGNNRLTDGGIGGTAPSYNTPGNAGGISVFGGGGGGSGGNDPYNTIAGEGGARSGLGSATGGGGASNGGVGTKPGDGGGGSHTGGTPGGAGMIPGGGGGGGCHTSSTGALGPSAGGAGARGEAVIITHF